MKDEFDAKLKKIAQNLHGIGFTKIKIASLMEVSYEKIDEWVSLPFTEAVKHEAVKRWLGGERRVDIAKSIGCTPQSIVVWRKRIMS